MSHLATSASDDETQETIRSGGSVTWLSWWDQPSEVVLQVAPSVSAGSLVEESFEALTDGLPTSSLTEVRTPDGARMHILGCLPGRLTVAYRARLQAGVANNDPGTTGHAADYERQVYLRPSRYCPSDHLIGFAVAQFGTGPNVVARVAAITNWDPATHRLRARVEQCP